MCVWGRWRDVGNETKGERDLVTSLVWEERGPGEDVEAENERVSR